MADDTAQCVPRVAFTDLTESFLDDKNARCLGMFEVSRNKPTQPRVEDDEMDMHDYYRSHFGCYLRGMFAGLSAFQPSVHGSDTAVGNMLRFTPPDLIPHSVPDAVRVSNTWVRTNGYGRPSGSPFVPHWLWCTEEGQSWADKHFRKDGISDLDIKEIEEQHEQEYDTESMPSAPQVLCERVMQATPPPLLRGDFVVQYLHGRPSSINYPTVRAFRGVRPILSQLKMQLRGFQEMHPKDILPMGLLVLGVLNYWYEGKVGHRLNDPKAPSMAEYLVYFVPCVVRSVTMGTVLILDPLEFAINARECDKNMRRRTGDLPSKIQEDKLMSEILLCILDGRPPKCVGRLLTSDLQDARQPGVDPSCPIFQKYLNVPGALSPREKTIRQSVRMIGNVRAHAAGQFLDTKAARHAVILPIQLRQPWDSDALEVFEGPAPDEAQWPRLQRRHDAKIHQFYHIRELRLPAARVTADEDEEKVQVDAEEEDDDEDEDLTSEPGLVDRTDALDAELQGIQTAISATLDRRYLCKQGLVEEGGHGGVGPADAVRLVEGEIEALYRRKIELQARRDRAIRFPGLPDEQPEGAGHDQGRAGDGMGGSYDGYYDDVSPAEKNRKRVWDMLLDDGNLGPQEKRQKPLEQLPDWYRKDGSVKFAARIAHACDISARTLWKGGELLVEAEAMEKQRAMRTLDVLSGVDRHFEGWQRAPVQDKTRKALKHAMEILEAGIQPVPGRFKTALERAAKHVEVGYASISYATPHNGWEIVADEVMDMAMDLKPMRTHFDKLKEGATLDAHAMADVKRSLDSIYNGKMTEAWFDRQDYKLAYLQTAPGFDYNKTVARLLQWHQIVSRWLLFCMYAMNGMHGRINSKKDSRPCSWEDMRKFGDGILEGQRARHNVPRVYGPDLRLDRDFTADPKLGNKIPGISNDFNWLQATIRRPYEQDEVSLTPFTYRFTNHHDFFFRNAELQANLSDAPWKHRKVWYQEDNPMPVASAPVRFR
ncbi:hypothetical protein PG984_007751 [Apiospora sp. TS-2023a]